MACASTSSSKVTLVHDGERDLPVIDVNLSLQFPVRELLSMLLAFQGLQNQQRSETVSDAVIEIPMPNFATPTTMAQSRTERAGSGDAVMAMPLPSFGRDLKEPPGVLLPSPPQYPARTAMAHDAHNINAADDAARRAAVQSKLASRSQKASASGPATQPPLPRRMRLDSKASPWSPSDGYQSSYSSTHTPADTSVYSADPPSLSMEAVDVPHFSSVEEYYASRQDPEQWPADRSISGSVPNGDAYRQGRSLHKQGAPQSGGGYEWQ